MVLVVPEPEVFILPGIRLMIQSPLGGRLLRTTLPVATSQEGWVIVPTEGVEGVSGCSMMVADVPDEMHPVAFFAVTVYEPLTRLLKIPVELT